MGEGAASAEKTTRPELRACGARAGTARQRCGAVPVLEEVKESCVERWYVSIRPPRDMSRGASSPETSAGLLRTSQLTSRFWCARRGSLPE